MIVSCQSSSTYYFINNTMAIPFTADSYKVSNMLMLMHAYKVSMLMLMPTRSSVCSC